MVLLKRIFGSSTQVALLVILGFLIAVTPPQISQSALSATPNETISMNPQSTCNLASFSNQLGASDYDYMKDLFDSQKPFALVAVNSNQAITLAVKNNGNFDLRKFHPKHRNQFFTAKRDPSCYNAITLTHLQTGSVVANKSQGQSKSWFKPWNKSKPTILQPTDQTYFVDYNPISKSITLRSRETYAQGLMDARSGYLHALSSESRTLFDQEFKLIPGIIDLKQDFNPSPSNGVGQSNPPESFRIPFASNAKVEVSQGPYGRFSHQYPAMDFAAVEGTPVLAAKSGKVIRANYLDGIGNNVVIDHGNKQYTKYGHLSKINVSKGDFVEQAKVIGKVGSTGNSTGPHLHFEYHTGSTSNPTMLKFVEFSMEKFRGRSDYEQVKGTMSAK